MVTQYTARLARAADRNSGSGDDFSDDDSADDDAQEFDNDDDSMSEGR